MGNDWLIAASWYGTHQEKWQWLKPFRMATCNNDQGSLFTANMGCLLGYACLGGGKIGNKQAAWKTRFVGLDFENIRSAFIAATIVAKMSSSNSACSESISATSDKGTTTTLDAGRIVWLPKQRQKASITKMIRRSGCLNIFDTIDRASKTKRPSPILAMVLRLLSNSREISFRLDDCSPEKSGATPHRSNFSIQALKIYVNDGFASFLSDPLY